jgi:hypothetical protein
LGKGIAEGQAGISELREDLAREPTSRLLGSAWAQRPSPTLGSILFTFSQSTRSPKRNLLRAAPRRFRYPPPSPSQPRPRPRPDDSCCRRSAFQPATSVSSPFECSGAQCTDLQRALCRKPNLQRAALKPNPQRAVEAWERRGASCREKGVDSFVSRRPNRSRSISTLSVSSA